MPSRSAVEAAGGEAGAARRVVGGGERHRRAAVERDARRRDDRGGVEIGRRDGTGGNVEPGQVEWHAHGPRIGRRRAPSSNGREVDADRADDARCR